MIIEGILSTRDENGEPHVAAMGPWIDPDGRRLQLRPFPSSHSWQNLQREPYGVFHITDDVEHLVWAALGGWPEAPVVQPAHRIPGFVLGSACRWYEFRVVEVDQSQPRIAISCEIMHIGHLREMSGWNRAQFAVLEATILATRLDWMDRHRVEQDLERWRLLVDKTGGQRERRAMRFVEEYITKYYRDKEGRNARCSTDRKDNT